MEVGSVGLHLGAGDPVSSFISFTVGCIMMTLLPRTGKAGLHTVTGHLIKGQMAEPSIPRHSSYERFGRAEDG